VSSAAEPGTLGLYVHVPFCERICPYCDFAVVAARRLARADEERYVASLLDELAARASAFPGLRLDTIYFGGGTPSLLAPASIGRLIGAARARFGGDPREVTLEVNPSTVERERLPGFQDAGVSRLSLGVQSFDDDTLRRLGRAHRADEARATLAAARDAGFANLSLDLIFGAPGQSQAQVLRDVAAALALAPEHVSAYALTLESGTPFARAAQRGRLALPDDDAVADMMSALGAALEAGGLARYEISSWAQPGRRSLHNARYWRREPVLGIGVGAHSHEPPRAAEPFGARSANERDLARYLARIESGQRAAPEREVLSEATARGEAVFLALRMREGLAADAFAREFGAPPRALFAAALDDLCARGLLAESADGDLRLTDRGWLFADEVASRFV
jgi:oxygen-independent coproporphyrinogen-3 oxidase